MRLTIALLTAGVLLAAGIAVSQQPLAGGAPPANPGATPPGISATPALPPPAGPDGTAITVPGRPGGAYPNLQPYGAEVFNQLPHVGRLFAVDDDPEIAELNQLDQQLERESRDLVNQLAQSDEDDAKTRDETKAKLRDALEKQFDTQQKVRDIEISRIEERVKKLRDVVNKRNAARRTIVDRRQQQLIDEAEGFGWSSPGTAGSGAAFDRYSAQPQTMPPAAAFPRPIWNRNTGAPRSSVTRPGGPGGPLGVESPAANEAPGPKVN